MPARKLHPALVAHGRKVAAAHQSLRSKPAYKAATPQQRMQLVQTHIRRGGVK